MNAPTLCIVLVGTVAVSMLGCTHGTTPVAKPGVASAGRASEIARPELDSLRSRYRNVYDLIRAVRPGMLISRELRAVTPSRDAPRSEPSGVKVFVDDVYVGGVDVLAAIPIRSIVFVHRMTATDATTRYGSGMTGGVIAITTAATRWR